MKVKSISALICLFVLASAFKEKPKDLIKLKKAFTSKYAYIPNGAATIDEKVVETGAFFMCRTEVTNLNYAEFLNSLTNAESKEKYAVQPEKWTEMSESASPMAEHYYKHPAYGNYPVVNITKEAASAYCEWLTSVYETMDIGLPEDTKMVFKLPTRAEWVNAANGELTGPYAWGGPYLRNTKGEFLANFITYGPENIHRNTDTGEYEVIPLPVYMGTPGNFNDNADILAPVQSYAPNRYGLQNMNGNAAEMLADIDQAAGGSWRSPGYDIRNESLMNFEEASPEVGFRPIAILTKK
jgi:formylglycine-generating enzyme required for sulfatase activity